MKKSILIVENQDINRLLLSQILSGEYEVIEATNGIEAMEVLKQQSAQISLMLLDIVLPLMDGYEVLRRTAENPAYAGIPIIITANSTSKDAELNALALGATEFVTKPYQPDILLHRIKSILKLRESVAMVSKLQNDQLTGLFNRDFFLNQAQKFMDAHAEERCDVFCCNVVEFHAINEKYGDEVGDQLLKEMALILRAEIPEEEILISRFYADYFLGIGVRQNGIAKERLEQVSDKIIQRISLPNVGIKWGVALDEKDGTPVEKMCDDAIMAVHSLKGNYEKRFCIFNYGLEEQLIEEHMVVDELDEALENHWYQVYLQPKVKKDAGCWRDAEALVRCNHPKVGIVQPDVFIPVLEKTRLIYKLDWYVWEEICRILRRWKNMGIEDISVSVNVSRVDVYQKCFVEQLLALVEKYGVKPCQLHLEITETAYVKNEKWLSEIGAQLRQKGFVIEMDDFGTGYSSFHMLAQIPLDIIKLDKSMIIPGEKHTKILQHLVALAHDIELEVVAEGVETQEQCDSMFDIGCDYIQGYFAAKPMPWQEFEQELLKIGNRGGYTLCA